jgi:hypothetical protein
MKVALYIYTESLENTSEYIVNNFKNRVIADGGVFEADSCCIDVVQSLGGSFDTYTTAKRIELYDDEKISITSSIQNISDISKVFTDYTQSFTIPASENNNRIFKHWYENGIDNAYDQRITSNGFIEIDTQIFRIGKWQLESASVKNNRIEDYKITFYGDLKSLTDKFGENKLKDLDTLNNYSIEYSGTNVKNLVKSSSAENVMFPFISSERLWHIGGGLTANNINTNGHALDYKELFPAVRVSSIFNAIEDKFNINFDGTFLQDPRFTSAYLWFKNGEQAQLILLGSPVPIDFISIIGFDDNNSVNLTNNTIKLLEENYFNSAFVRLELALSSSVVSLVSVFRDDVFAWSFSNNGSTIYQDIYIPNEDIGVEYRFEISTSQVVTYTGTLSPGFDNENTGETSVEPLVSLSGSTSSNLSLTSLAPDMKVSDFFSGILKMFNLTAFSTDGINFTLEQLENWYYLGGIKDFSGYCTTDFEHNRIKPYKKIDFKYEKSESFMNRAFFENSQREYGDLTYTFNSDGSDYTIKLPFENLLFNRFVDYFQVGYALKQDFAKYVPKPIILYRYGLQPATYHFDNGLTKTTETQYNAFGQETLFSGFKNTINWGVEISSLDLQLVNNTLFNNYYLAYLNNLYSLKSRMVKVKMRLPYNELLSLKLNDRIIIRDKRYIINQYTTDLTTFESDFELIQDFRSIDFNNSGIQRVNNEIQIIKIDTTSVEPLTWSVFLDDDLLVKSISNFDTYVNVEIINNISGIERVAIIESNLNDRIIIRQDA